MTTDTLHPLAAEYLERLRRAGPGLPPGRRRELLTEIEGHLSKAIDPNASGRYQWTPCIRCARATCSVEACSSGSSLPLAAADSGKTL
jgi:hypothetical protein